MSIYSNDELEEALRAITSTKGAGKENGKTKTLYYEVCDRISSIY